MFLSNSLLPGEAVTLEDAVTEKDLDQNLADIITENNGNKNLWLDIQRRSNEAQKIKKEIKWQLKRSNRNNFFLLDLQKRLVKVLKKYKTKDKSYLNGLNSNIVLCNRKEHKVGLFNQG